MATTRGRATGPGATNTAPYYVQGHVPTGGAYWYNPNRPDTGYLVDPTKNPGAIGYPIEYINWFLRPTPPTAGEVRPAAAGRAREVGGQALNGKIGILYGERRIAPSIFFGPRNVITNPNAMVVGYGLSHGPCHSLVATKFPHGKTLAELASVYQQAFYPGSLTPAAADPAFVSAVGGGVTTATLERYPGLSYVAATLTANRELWEGISGAIPMPLFTLKGRLVRNYQTGLDEWTDNPAYCTADYLTSTRYGQGAKVNTQSVIDAAAYCDETFVNAADGLTYKKHTLNYFLLRPADHRAHLNALRAHFRCSIIERGGEYIFLIDKDRATAASFNEQEAIPISVERLGGTGIPNTVIVRSPNPANDEQIEPQYARTSGAETGDAAAKEAEYDLEGLSHPVHQATEAFYLLNTRLNNLRVVLRAVHQKARKLEPNDVIEYTTTSFGMASFKLRVLRVTRAADGMSWLIECAGHDPAIYSFQSRAIESFPLPSLPNMNAAPAAPSGVSITDIGNSVLAINFTPPPDNPLYSHTRVIMERTIGGVTETTVVGEAQTGPLVYQVVGDEATYVAKAKTINRNDKESAWAASDPVVKAGVSGPTGPAGVSYFLTNEAATIATNTDGTGGDYSTAEGDVKVFSGTSDVTAAATFGVPIATGCTGTVNTAADTPVAGKPKGYYRVTAASADTATLQIPVTYGGATVTLTFTVAKSKQGSVGSSAKILRVTANRQTITYNGAGGIDPASQPVTFTAAKQNTTSTVAWTMSRLDGTVLDPALYLSATTGDSVSMTAASFDIARGTTMGVVVTGTVVDGVTLTDRVSVIRVSDGKAASTLLAELNAATAVGGRIIIAPTTKLSSDLAVGVTSLVVDAASFAVGDRLVLQTAPGGVAQTEFMVVTAGPAGTGPYTYTVTRNADGSGENAWKLGDVAISTGNASGGGFIDVYSSVGLKSGTEYGPTMVGNVRNSGTWDDWSPRWALGNLKGLYGYAADTYGAAFGVPSGAWLKVDPTNGIRIGHNVTTKVQIDASGNASFTGTVTATAGAIGGWTIASSSLTAGAGSAIKAGQSAFNTGTGFWLGDDGGTPKLSIGNPAGNRLTWDGTTLAITGSLTLTNTIPAGSVSGLAAVATSGAYGALSGVPTSLSAVNAAEGTKLAGIAAGADVTLAAVNGGLSLTGGGLILASGGAAIRGGQTAYNTGSGFWLGDVAGTTKLSIGSSSGNRLTWDGTNLNIVGSGTFSGTVYASAGSFTGEVTATSGSFTGAITATSGSFTGTVNASSGTIGGWSITGTALSTTSGYGVSLDANSGRITFASGSIHSNGGTLFLSGYTNVGSMLSVGTMGPTYYPVELDSGGSFRSNGSLVYDGATGDIRAASYMIINTVVIDGSRNGSFAAVTGSGAGTFASLTIGATEVISSNRTVSAYRLYVNGNYIVDENAVGNFARIYAAGTELVDASKNLYCAALSCTSLTTNGGGITCGGITSDGYITTSLNVTGAYLVANNAVYVGSNQVVGPRGSALTDLGYSADMVDVVDAINAIHNRLRGHGLVS